jgi:hypothetical protein
VQRRLSLKSASHHKASPFCLLSFAYVVMSRFLFRAFHTLLLPHNAMVMMGLICCTRVSLYNLFSCPIRRQVGGQGRLPAGDLDIRLSSSSPTGLHVQCSEELRNLKYA